MKFANVDIQIIASQTLQYIHNLYSIFKSAETQTVMCYFSV